MISRLPQLQQHLYTTTVLLAKQKETAYEKFSMFGLVCQNIDVQAISRPPEPEDCDLLFHHPSPEHSWEIGCIG